MRCHFSYDGKDQDAYVWVDIGHDRIQVNGSVDLDPGHEYAIAASMIGGYFEEYVELTGAPDPLHVPLTPFPEGPIGAWHEAHGIDDGDNERGQGIKIGIIDEALGPQAEESCIAHVYNLSGSAWGGAPEPMTDHGTAVCSLLGSRTDGPYGFQGIAPGADFVFAAAQSERSRNGRVRVSAANLIDSLEMLVVQEECDLISISCGDVEEPMPELERVVDGARRRGTLCIFAAGNKRICRYPARYMNCFSVGALGIRGVGPAGSLLSIREDHEAEVTDSHELYCWNMSARGKNVDCVAVGVGPIWNFQGVAYRTCAGTSYAAPIATGCIAVLLSEDATFKTMARDLQRTEYVEQLARRNCANLQLLGNDDILSQSGIIRVR